MKLDLDAAGRFPAAPWEYVEIKPRSKTPYTDVTVISALETVEQKNPLFTALAVTFYPDGDWPWAYSAITSSPVSEGPVVTQTSPINGTIYLPDDPNNPDGTLWVIATIQDNLIETDKIVALYNGRKPTLNQKSRITLSSFDGGVNFSWGIQPREIEQGTRICFGGVSIAGHESINMIEFTESPGGLLVGVSELTSQDACSLRQ